MSVLSRTALALMAVVSAMLLQVPGSRALAQTVDRPAGPATYALVAAVGHTFSFVSEKSGAGSQLEPYDRTEIDVDQDLLNRLALRSLDQIIAASTPDSQRLLFSLPARDVSRIGPANREQAAINAVVKAMQGVPGRQQWDKIVVVTPAYRARPQNGMAGRLEGFGLFIEPVCKSGKDECEHDSVTPVNGETALTPDGKTVTASTFQAPFSYLCIWTLDPKTLAVLSKEEVFEHQKLSDPMAGVAPMVASMDTHWVGGAMLKLIDDTIHEAIRRSGLTATVEVRPVKETQPQALPPAIGN